MAALAKNGTPSLCTAIPEGGERVGTFISAEVIGAGDACHLNASGQAIRSNGAAADANAKVIGWAGINVNVGEPLTLWVNINYGYGTATTVVPDTVYYLSGTVLGGLDTVASVGGTKPIAVGLPNGRLHVIRFLG